VSDIVVRVEQVSKKFCRNLRRSLWYGVQDLSNELMGRQRKHCVLRRDEHWAVEGISFELRRGECLGLIGHNGAGKTTLLRMLNGLITPDHGRIEIRGRVGALIALGAGFNPILSGRENVYVNAAVLGLGKRETDRRFDEIVEFSGLREFIDAPVQQYSSGMQVRLGFSVAAHLEPDVLLVDEALAVGDLAFIIKCLNRIAELRASGTGVIFVSHSELQVREAADDCILLHHGKLVAKATPEEVFRTYGELLAEEAEEAEDAGYVYAGPIRLHLRSGPENGSPAKGRTGGPLELVFQLDIGQSVRGAAFELRFWNSHGQLVSTIRSLVAGKTFDFDSGSEDFIVEIPALPLPPGRYRIASGFRKSGQVLGWSRDAGYVQVDNPDERWLGTGLVPMRAALHGKSASKQQI
jgi:lipopolysaccharide transport system ATP-binding protein